MERILCREMKMRHGMTDEEVQYHKYFSDIVGVETKGKKICFFHNCCLDKGLNIFNKYINRFILTGLFDAIDWLYIINLGEDLVVNLPCQIIDKVKIINYSPQIGFYEIPTLNLLYLFSKFNPETKILYLHSKGITHTERQNNTINTWIEYMLYFLVDNHKLCIDLLDYYNTLGCDMHKQPQLHYSGNFWWTTAKHILDIGPISNESLAKFGRHAAEWWILSKPNKNLCLYNSNNDFYITSIFREVYDTEATKQMLNGYLAACRDTSLVDEIKIEF